MIPTTFGGDLAVQCSWCKAIRVTEYPERWSKRFTLVEREPVTHSICPVCFAKETANMLTVSQK